MIYGLKLSFSSVMTSQAGNYICTISNNYGTLRKTVNLNVGKHSKGSLSDGQLSCLESELLSGTWAPEILGTWLSGSCALGLWALWQSGTWALKRLGTWGLGHLVALGTWEPWALGGLGHLGALGTWGPWALGGLGHLGA
jgi:hypothetical protein